MPTIKRKPLTSKSLLMRHVNDWWDEGGNNPLAAKFDVENIDEISDRAFESHILEELNRRFHSMQTHWTRMTNLSHGMKVSWDDNDYDCPEELSDWLAEAVGDYFIVSRTPRRSSRRSIDSVAFKTRNNWVWLNRPRNALALERKFMELPTTLGICMSCNNFGPVVVEDLTGSDCCCGEYGCVDCFSRYCKDCVTEDWALLDWGA